MALVKLIYDLKRVSLGSSLKIKVKHNIYDRKEKTMNNDRKKIGLFSAILFGIGLIFPIAPVAIYGTVQPISMGHMAICYMLAAIPMTFTAWSFGAMGAEFPRAGSSYTFVANGINPYLGFMTGWGILMDYILFPIMNFVISAVYVQELFGWTSGTSYWIIIAVSVVLVAVMNLLGIKSIATMNNIITIFGFLVVIYFVISACGALGSGAGDGFTPIALYNPETFDVQLILAGTAIACFSFLGFDGITTLVEDIKEPKKNLPKATIFTCLIMMVVFMVMAYLGQCVYPDFNGFANPDSAFIDVAMAAGGETLANIITIAVIVCAYAFSLDMLAGVTRLLFGMGRDGVLPKKFFGYQNKKGVPVYNVLLISVICLVGCNMSLGDLFPLIDFGGIFAFILVNLAVIIHFFGRKKQRSGSCIFKYLIAPGLGFLACIVVWLSLSSMAKTVGFIWLGIGLIYMVAWTRGFKRPMKPIADISDLDDAPEAEAASENAKE